MKNSARVIFFLFPFLVVSNLMKQIFVFAILLCLLFATNVSAASIPADLIVSITQGGEEFVGPFPNWINAKTGKRFDGTGSSICTASVGNGVADDTAALQSCFTALNSTNPILWVPAGSYLVSTHLDLLGQIYMSVIGENPATTTIKWSPAAGAHSVIKPVGVAYSRINRLTLDGQNVAYSLITQEWDGLTGQFDTGNEYADNILKNSASYGIICGYDQGCSEVAVLRDTFSNIGRIALSLGEPGATDFNALDVWVWYSKFQNNATAVGNFDGAGNAHVFNSIFSGSTTADFFVVNTGIMTLHGNYSSGSNQFINCGGSLNPNNLTVDANTVLDTTLAATISCGDLGPVVLFDNNIRSLAPAAAPIVTGANADIFSTGNNYTVASPVSGSRIHSIGDNVLSLATFNSSINTAAPTLPPTPPNNSRTIFEVTAGSSTATIQAAINSAAAAGVGSVVHLQASAGAYSITSTLTVPSGAFIQVIGDGGYTHLTWAGAGTGPMLQCSGPCRAVFRDFLVDGNAGSANCVVVTNADQPGSRVFMEGVFPSFSTGTNFVVNALDYTNVELHDFQTSAAGTAGLSVIGGSSAAGGNWLGGATNIFGGASHGNGTAFAMTNNAHLNVRQFWNDADGSASAKTITALSGTGGAFSIAGMAAYLNNTVATTHSFSLTNFSGTSALLNVGATGSTQLGDEVISGSGTGANNLTIGYVGLTASPFSDTTSPSDTRGFLNGQSTFCVGAATCPGQGSGTVAESGSSTLGFINTALTPLRASQPTVPRALATGVTDTRFYRVYTQNCLNGLQLMH